MAHRVALLVCAALMQLLVLHHVDAADCTDEVDCSLAGACTAGACECDKGYTGRFCERLREGRTHLVWPPQSDMPWSAGWGASVRRDPNAPGKWHAFVDTICQANRTVRASQRDTSRATIRRAPTSCTLSLTRPLGRIRLQTYP